MDDIRKRVLLIDKSVTIIKRLSEMFSDDGIEVFSSNSSLEGIRLFHEISPQMVIVDSIVDDLSGYDIARYIKFNPDFREVIVVLYSSDYDEKSKLYFKDTKAEMITNKGEISSDEFYQKCNDLLQKSKSQVDFPDYPGDNMVISIIENLMNKSALNNYIRDRLFEISSDYSDTISSITEYFKIIFDYFSTCIITLTYQYNNKHLCYIQSNDVIEEDRVKKVVELSKKKYKEQNNIVESDVRIKDKRLPVIKNKMSESGETERISFKIKYNGYYQLLLIERKILFEEEKEILYLIVEYFKNTLNNSLLFNDILIKKQEINNAFSKFLPQKIINDLMQKKSTKELMIGERRNITVIFSHIRDFSAIEKENTAEDIVAFLNKHFTLFSESIKNYGGEINKYIGDAVFAMFGAPESYEDNADRSIRSAVEMILRVNNGDNYQIKTTGQSVKIGIGIHQGDAIIGNIGSKDNFDYTAIGDTINLAARLESLNKYYDTEILISETVYKEAINYKTPVFIREIDTIKVKGKKLPTTIYSVRLINPFTEDFLETYYKGLKMFKLGNWNLANDFFTNAKNSVQYDKVTEIYLERISEFLKNPPLEWDGSIKLNFK